jgi:hypothetical protein
MANSSLVARRLDDRDGYTIGAIVVMPVILNIGRRAFFDRYPAQAGPDIGDTGTERLQCSNRKLRGTRSS